jgi:hypothetical protein
MSPSVDKRIGYIWNTKWIYPYESIWGVTEKFLYLNRLDRLNGNHFPVKVRASSKEYFPDHQNYIYYDNLKYDPLELSLCFGINTKKHYTPLKIFSKSSIEDYMDKKVRFCPECIRMGYHSYFHQLIFENTCFLHAEELIHTEIPYCMKYSPHAMYENIFSGNTMWQELFKANIPAFDELLFQLIYKKDLFTGKILPVQNIEHIEIINLNGTETDFHSGKTLLYNYLQMLFHYPKLVKCDKILMSMDKSKAKAMWTDYCYKPPQHSKVDCDEDGFSWFSNFCYNYSKELYDSCDESLLQKTLNEFNNSYHAQVIKETRYDYDPTSICIIITCAILTGYSYQEEKTKVFSMRWKQRKRVCLCEGYFLLKVRECKEDYLKTIYLELYKCVARAVYSIVKKDSDAGVFSGKNYLQIAADVELPIYLIVERAERVEVIEISGS